MEPKFVGGKHKKQTEMEPVFDFNADVDTVVHQIVSDLREKQNDELRKRLAVSWKELEWVKVKTGGNKLEISVDLLDGSLRQPKKNPAECQKKLKETIRVLERFEDAIRKEFRSRTNKALTWVDPHVHADFELIALNGLCRFFARKFGEIKTSLPGQKFSE
jgi:hypothetical protein